MHVDKETREAIDACRPEGEDLTLPELSHLADELQSNPRARLLLERTQRFDVRLADAFQDVDVPNDLAARILAGLGKQAPNGAVSLEVTAPLEVTASRGELAISAADSVSSGGFPRRRTISAKWIATAAAILVIATVALHGLSLRRAVTIEQLADSWLAEASAEWKPLASAPQQYAIPDSIAANALGWQRFGAFGQPQVVAFRLSRGELRGTLFVAKTSLADAPPSPPARPQFSTGGRCVGAWQSAGKLYVLIVEGDDSRYRSFIKSTQPLA